MRLRELYKLEIGDKLSLKGTNMVFEINYFDSSDPECPVMVTLLRGNASAVHNFMGEDPMMVIPNDPIWVYSNKKTLFDNANFTESELKSELEGCVFLTVRNLEVYKRPQELQESYESNTTEEIQESKIHQMFELPSPEELRKLAIQFHLDDISRIIKDAARRGETSVNLPDKMVEMVSDVLVSAGYRVEPFKPSNRCIIGW